MYNGSPPALIAAWAGEPRKAKEYFEWFEDKWATPKDLEKLAAQHSIPEERVVEFWKKISTYIETFRGAIKNPEKLRYNFIESVKALKLEKAAYQDIEGVSYKETYFNN